MIRYAPPLIFLFVPLVLLFRGLFASTAYTGLDWNYFLYPFYTFARDVYLEEGRLPFWNPYVMGGMPFLSSLNAFTLYPTELLSLPWRFEPWTFYVLDMLLHLWLAGMGIYALERRLGLSSLPSVVGGLAFSLGGSIHSLAGAGHVRWLRGMGLMPWVFYCLIRSERTGSKTWLSAAGGLLALMALTASADLVLYAMPIITCWLLLRGFGTVRQRLAGLMVLGFTLAGVSAVVWLPGLEYYLLSVRSSGSLNYTTQWAMTLWDFLTFLVPDFFGVPGTYWGPHAFRSTTDYLGVLPMGLAAMALMTRWTETKPWTFLAGITLFLALLPSTPLAFVFKIIPFYSGMRASLHWLSFFHLALVVLMGFGLQQLVDGQLRSLRVVNCVLFVVGALGVLAVTRIDQVVDNLVELTFVTDHLARIELDRVVMKKFLTASLLWASGMFVTGGVVLLLYLTRVVSPTVGCLLVALHLSIDLLRACAPYAAHAPVKNTPDVIIESLRALEKDPPTHYRVASEEFFALPNKRMQEGVQWVFGYHGLPLAHYIHLYVNTKAPYSKMRSEAYKILNVKYRITRGDLDEPWVMRVRNIAAHGDQWAIFHDVGAKGRLFLADRVVKCRNMVEVIEELRKESWDSRIVPIVSDVGLNIGEPGTNRMSFDEEVWKREEIVVRVNLKRRGLVVFSETWYPAWKAFLDGNRVKVGRAYGALRSIEVPEGEHTIRMVWDSLTFKVGLFVASFFVLCLIMLCGVAKMAGSEASS